MRFVDNDQRRQVEDCLLRLARWYSNPTPPSTEGAIRRAVAALGIGAPEPGDSLPPPVQGAIRAVGAQLDLQEALSMSGAWVPPLVDQWIESHARIQSSVRDPARSEQEHHNRLLLALDALSDDRLASVATFVKSLEALQEYQVTYLAQ